MKITISSIVLFLFLFLTVKAMAISRIISIKTGVFILDEDESDIVPSPLYYLKKTQI